MQYITDPFRADSIPTPKRARAAAASLAGLLAILSSYGWSAGPVACEQTLCVVVRTALADTDGDGFSDADEEAAGTDPHNAASHPPVLSLVHLASLNRLPSFAAAHSEIVVLPTRFPSGESLGARIAWPARDEGLARLGITSTLLGKAGLDGARGIRIQADPSSLLGMKAGSRPPVKVAGLDVGLISAGGSGGYMSWERSNSLFGMSPNAGQAASRTNTLAAGNDRFETIRTYGNGATDVQNTGKDGGMKQTSYDPKGAPIATATQGPTVARTNPDGSTSEGHNFTSQRGNETTTGGKDTTRHPDGSVTNQTAQVDVTRDNNGNIISSTTTVTVTTTDPNGKSTTSTTSVECSASGCSTPVTNTTTNEDGGYRNPDADYDVVYITEADVHRVVSKATGWNTTPGPVQEGPSDVDPSVVIVNGSFDPLIALIDDQHGADDGALFATPDIGGKAQPESDPRLPSILDHLGPKGWCGSPC